MSDGTKEYDITKIQKLEGIEHVRTRPAMYIGDTVETGLHHLIYEVVDNSIDEAVAGFGEQITVIIQNGDTIRVEDRGRGIPTGIHPKTKVTGVEMVMTELFAGGKFDNDSYKTSGGLHGVGVSCVNALSEWCEVEVCRDGKVHHQRYERGVAVAPLKVIGEADFNGTTTTFKPDPTIFEVLEFKFDIVQKRLRELAYLNKGVKIALVDERDEGRTEIFHYEGGISAYVEYLNEGTEPLHEEVIHAEGESDGVWVEVALQYNTGYRETIHSFANNINTREGGTHLSGFKSSLSRTLLAFANANSMLKKKDKNPEGADWREGLTAILSVRIPEPKFEGQTKQKLGNKEVEGKVQSALNKALNAYFEVSHPVGMAIVSKGIRASQVREKARAARDAARKSALSGKGLPGKLADCSRKGREGTEVFLVEGDSAGGTAKSGREKEFQAILPLRGKILNVEKAPPEKMMAHQEIDTIIKALGCKFGAEFDITGLRYDKIILMCDADVDGSHIRTLLLTFFFRHMRPLVEAGHIYVAQPPLYKVKLGKNEEYVTSDAEMNEKLVLLGQENVALYRGDEVIDGETLAELLGELVQVEEHASRLHRHRISLADFLGRWDAERQALPRVMVIQDGGAPSFFFSRAESEQYVDTLRAAAPEDEPPVVYEGDGIFSSRPEQCIERIVLDGSSGLAEALVALGKRGFEPKSLIDGNGNGLHIKVSGADAASPLDGLLSLLSAVRTVARTASKSGKKLDVQRYKGLGEMNDKELWKTTMDPAKRTLKQVTIEDDVRSDRMFKMLMGTAVTERREFILDHALEATDVDV